MSGRIWYVNSGRVAVDLDLVVLDGIATDTVYRLAEVSGTTNLRVALWSLPGTAVSKWLLQQAKLEQSTDPVPAGYIPGATGDDVIPARIVDGAGIPWGVGNPLPVDVGANLVVDNVTLNQESVVSALNSRTTPLAANETFLGSWEEVRNYAAISLTLATDAGSATQGVIMEWSADGIDIVTSDATAIPPGGAQAHFSVPIKARYFRLRYINGPVAQTVLEQETCFRFHPPAVAQQSLGSELLDSHVGGLARSATAGRMSTGQWISLLANSSGHLSTRVENLAALEQAVDGVEAKQDAAKVVLDAIRLLLDGVLDVQVTNQSAPLTDGQLRATPVAVSTGLDVLTDGQLRATPVAVSTVDSRGLAERMLAKAPLDGYGLWLDVLATTTDRIVIAEAPNGSLPSAAVFNGVRVTLVGGKPLGLVEVALGFAWADRATAGWS